MSQQNKSQSNQSDAAENEDTWEQDLHPDRSADRNDVARTAYDMEAAHRNLSDMADDDMKQIPIVADGVRLEQGATYIDLLAGRTEFSAIGSMEAGQGHAYVAKNDVDYQMWNRLIGVENPERTGEDENA